MAQHPYSSPVDPALAAFDYPVNQQRGLFESPHQPHGLTAYPQGNIHQGPREEEAAASMRSLAVQPNHGGSIAAHTMYTQDNNRGFSRDIDPALTSRPIGRFEEQVQHHKRDIEAKLEDQSEDGVHIPSGNYLYNNGL